MCTYILSLLLPCFNCIVMLFILYNDVLSQHVIMFYAPLPQRPVAGRKLVGKRIFHFRPISSDIGRTHFNLSRKDGAVTLLAGV